MQTSPANLRYTNRWFAYFDLLGFKNLVLQHELEKVLPIYESALATIDRKTLPMLERGISYSWFSDTFVLFSKSDSAQDFAAIEAVARQFFQKLILDEIPVRGALSVGPLYTQQKKNIFIGQALIEAYEYGEDQNWLGFLLTPSACRHLQNISLDVRERAFYRPLPEKNILRNKSEENVYAFAFNNGSVQGKNVFLSALSRMKAEAPSIALGKYLQTESFIRENDRV